MAEKRKARTPAGKSRKPKETQEAQSARFIEAARAQGVDESGIPFERAITNLVDRKGRAKAKTP